MSSITMTYATEGGVVSGVDPGFIVTTTTTPAPTTTAGPTTTPAPTTPAPTTPL